MPITEVHAAGTVAAAALLGLLAAYWLGRLVVPRWRDGEHPHELDAVHAAMALAMIPMVVAGGLDERARTGLMGAFAVCAGWCVLRLARSRTRAAYGRSAVMSVAAAAMLMPDMSSMSGAAAGRAVTMGDTAHAGMAMGASLRLGDLTTLALPLTVAAMAAVAVAAVLVLTREDAPAAVRWASGAEIAMSIAMAGMVTAMV